MTRMLVLVLLAGCSSCDEETPEPVERVEVSPEGPRWLKGQLHLHSANSGDSETPPEEVVRYYAAHGYDFIVFTDHNHVTAPPSTGEMLVIPGVELTQNLGSCTPEVAGHPCNLHVNALFVDARHRGRVMLPPVLGSRPRTSVYWASMQRADQLGAVPMLNHPNFHHGADAHVLSQLCERGLRLFEVANEAVDSNNDGGERPSTEETWDAVLSRGHRLYGTATDDAHHYSDAEAVHAAGRIAHVGERGWVMVRATPEPDAIRDALLAGEFYATNGPALTRLDTRNGIQLATRETHEFRFVGEGGVVLRETSGTSASIRMDEVDGRYVRAVVDGPTGRAWVQPVFRDPEPAPRLRLDRGTSTQR